MAQHYPNPRRFDNRPQPLALNHGAYQQQHQHHYHHTQQHSAPLPRQHHGHNQAANPPLTAAWNQFQSDQLAYLAEMERSLALQQELQRQIVVQQQVEAQKAEQQYRLMLAAQQGQAQGQYGGGVYAQQQQAQRGYHTAPHQQANVQFYPPVDSQPAPAQAHDPNPLVASALARRAKRQSYNGTGPAGGEQQQQHPHAVYPGQGGQYRASSGPGTPRNVQDQRRSPSPYTGYHGAFGQSASPSPSSRGPRRPSPPPPAVILSAPGEPYPDTSSSGSSSSRATSEDGGSESGETRPSSPEREKDASSSPATLKAAKQLRRRSHLDSLDGLGSHASNRRQQNSGNGPQQGQGQCALGINGGSASKNPHQRAVSSPASSQQTSPSSPAAPSPLFSSARAMPPPVPGTSSAIRQPRGPPTELGDQNFSARIRARAVGEIKGLAKRRASGNVLAAPGAPVGVEELAQGMRAVAVC